MMHEMLNNELHFKVIGMKKIEIKEATANKKYSRVYFKKEFPMYLHDFVQVPYFASNT